MMPLEPASVIGSLAGLAEITREAFGRHDGSAQAAPASRAAAPRNSSVPST
jgi:hypothetical protein